MSFMGRGLVYGGPRPPLGQPPAGYQMIPAGSMLDPSQARLLANPAGLASQQQAMAQLANQTAQLQQQQQPPPMQASHLSLFTGTSQPSAMATVPNGSLLSGTPILKKRKVDEKSEHDGSLTPGLDEQDISSSITGKRFIFIGAISRVYQTEEWSGKQGPLYRPVNEDMLISTNSIEQVTFSSGSFFIADASGNYTGAQPGDAINIWRFDEHQKKLYVARSLLFLDRQSYINVRRQLEAL